MFSITLSLQRILENVLQPKSRPLKDDPMSAAVLIFIDNVGEPKKYPWLQTEAAKDFARLAQSYEFGGLRGLENHRITLFNLARAFC